MNAVTKFFKSFRPLFCKFNRRSSNIHLRYIGISIATDFIATTSGYATLWECSKERSTLLLDLAHIEAYFDDYMTDKQIDAHLSELKSWYLVGSTTPVLDIMINFCAANGVQVSQAELLKESQRVSFLFNDSIPDSVRSLLNTD